MPNSRVVAIYIDRCNSPISTYLKLLETHLILFSTSNPMAEGTIVHAWWDCKKNRSIWEKEFLSVHNDGQPPL